MVMEQVISPLLIVLRAAKQKAFTSASIGSGDIGVIHLSQDKPESDGTDEQDGKTFATRVTNATTDSHRSEV